jgi:hypothetical protein
MSWRLNLRYSSKIWRLLWNQGEAGDDGTLARRGPFGEGWLMTMLFDTHFADEAAHPQSVDCSSPLRVNR